MQAIDVLGQRSESAYIPITNETRTITASTSTDEIQVTPSSNTIQEENQNTDAEEKIGELENKLEEQINTNEELEEENKELIKDIEDIEKIKHNRNRIVASLSLFSIILVVCLFVLRKKERNL